MVRKYITLLTLSFVLAACSIFSGDDGVTLNDGVIVAGKDAKNKPEPKPTVAESKYDDILPATDFSEDESDRGPSDAKTGVEIETVDIVPSTVGRASSDLSDETEIRPVVLLDHSYTLRLGLFDSNEEATEFARISEIDTAQAGISKVMIERQIKFLLAYGIYGDLTEARDAAREFEERMEESVTVVSLASIKEISEWDEKEDEGILTR